MSTVDPGLGESISREAQDVEKDDHDSPSDDDHQDEDDRLIPSHWWFASTACPLLAGTFGPIANGFSICALVYHWRLRLPPGTPENEGIPIDDPAWLLAINALSLASALVGNASLLLNMARRVPFSIAQPVTITGFLLAGVLLIADMAALVASHNYDLSPIDSPAANHALSGAFYYAIFASAFYLMIAAAMCLTVYGANRGRYQRDFSLTPAQRTLMLQTMLFVAYLLLGALIYSHIEGWNYLVAVYWADVTLLTVGLGDFSPNSDVGRGLLFPFAIGGILMVGLVVGSIRSLILERGQEKLAARISEKRRESAVHNVDERKQTIRVSWFAKVDFSTDPSLSPAQRREEEFYVMRKVLKAAESERRWFGLVSSLFFALVLWLVGAAIFMVAERKQGWSYFDALYFSYFCLLTIGYGSPYVPKSNSGRAFFVVWSLLAVPSLTILISNMGDTIVKWFSDLTLSIGGVTVLPEDHGFRKSLTTLMQHFTPPGILGDVPSKSQSMSTDEHRQAMRRKLADRLARHLEEEELQEAKRAFEEGRDVEKDIHFFHYVLSREIRVLQKDYNDSPSKQYSWEEWEYYLKLIGDCEADEDDSDEENLLVPKEMSQANATSFPDRSPVDFEKDQAPQLDGVVDRGTEQWEKGRRKSDGRRHILHPSTMHVRRRKRTHVDLQDWSWLSDKSPLMSTKSETEWILERLSAALEYDLRHRRKGIKTRPPISMAHLNETAELRRMAE